MTPRFTALFAWAMAAFLGAVLFVASLGVQRAEGELRQVQNALRFEQDSLRVLRAEWDYLNRPDRLEKLAREHTDLVPPGTDVFLTRTGSLPEPLSPAIPARKPHTISFSATINESGGE